ncbi:WXG100 family type VII secretion target [Nonomuraea sp. B12E4]|uniref:WXG100 family type VII secretion target n=1 Tax=Nonomuraea sp. B12E4 TaxID=3153564 RepID=UPI00325D15B5
MSDRQVVTILNFTQAPAGNWETGSKSEIKQLLQNTDPAHLDGTGQTYQNAASKIEQALAALEEHAPKIADVWKGPDAAKARHALEMLNASGHELRGKLSMMGTALQTYAGHLRTAQAEVDKEVSVPAGVGTEGEEEVVRKALEDVQAQRALYDLNKKIVDVYTIDVPHDVSYELPTVSIPDTPVETRDPGYPTGPGSNGPTFGNSAYSGGGSDGGGSYGGGSGGTGPGNPGGGPNGSVPDGSNPANPDGSNPGGSDPGDPTAPDPNAPDPNAPDPAPTPVPGQTQPPGSDNGTVPPVIGGDGQTTTDGSNGMNPRQTDMASYQPPTTALTTPFTTTPTPFTTTTPPNLFTPTPPGGGSPMMPSVIGSPVIGGGPGATLAAGGGRVLGGTSAGMPMMPFMGGGAGAGDNGDMERNTFLTEDASCWTAGHDTTEPMIG